VGEFAEKNYEFAHYYYKNAITQQGRFMMPLRQNRLPTRK